jgi:hypothetical protein
MDSLLQLPNLEEAKSTYSKDCLESVELQYQKTEFDKQILSSNIDLEKENIRIVSIGHACQVSEHIRNLGLQENGTEFFDWLISDFSSLHYLLNENNLFDNEHFTDQPVFMPGKSWRSENHKIEHMKFKMISVHDYPSNIPWSDINEKKKYIDKYTRRWNRFKINFYKFKKNKLVSVFDHQWTKFYIPSKEEIKNVLDKLSILSNENQYQIHFVCVYNLYNNIEIKEFEEMIKDIDNCYFYILKKIDNLQKKSWKDEHLNWHDIMFKILNT